MTLIAGISSLPFAALCSDRLITLSRRGTYAGEHDTVSNKLIVVAARDAVVAIGYCGTAYLQRLTTDNWIVNTICPEQPLADERGADGFIGFRLPSNLRLHQMCNRLRTGLANCAGGSGVTIMIVGWRRKGRLLTPVHLVFGAAAVLRRSSKIVMRPTFPIEPRIKFIGASVSAFEMTNAIYNAEIRNGVMDQDGAVRFGKCLIRDKSVRDPTVGPHVMSVVLWNPTVRQFGYSIFSPSSQHFSSATVGDVTATLNVGYTPWFLTPNQFHAPTEQTGDPNSAASWQVGDWTFEMREEFVGPATPSMVGWTRPQSRRRSP